MTVTFPANSNIVPANPAEQLVFDFLTNMGPTLDEFKRDYRDHLTDDVIWDNVGFPVIKGIDAVSRQLAKYFPPHAGDRNELPDAPVVM